jgi:putative transposase
MGLRNRGMLVDEQCFFVTTTCYKHIQLLATEEAKNILSNSLNFLTEKYQCHILGYVIMPNHLHMILYFQADNRLSDFMRDFKKFTSVKLRQLVEMSGDTNILQALRYEHREQKLKVWVDRFDDVVIQSKEMFHTKLDYIHNNPLQAHWQLSDTAEDYKYSSAAFYDGVYSGVVNVSDYSAIVW